MSFLLRNRSGHGSGRSSSGRNDNRIIPRAPSQSHRQTKISRTSPAGVQMGNQVLIQRTTCSQLTKQQAVAPTNQFVEAKLLSTHEHQRQQRQETMGAISMSEVLADIRVLEQQQHDAAQKLESARATKQRRIHQQATLQSKLENLKYSNGELRQQRSQSRELLSVGTRSLGSRRLENENAGKKVRAFEKKLKRGLLAAHTSASCRRKIESLFIVLDSKIGDIQRLKTKAAEKLSVVQECTRNKLHHEEQLRNALQTELGQSQHHSSNIASLRAQTSETERNLLTAQKTEESTRTRAAALASEISDEDRKHSEHVTWLSSEIVSSQKHTVDIAVETEIVDKELGKQAQQLNEDREQTSLLSIELGVAVKDASPKQFYQFDHLFDRGTFTRQLEVTKTRAKSISNSNSQLKREIEELRVKLDEHESTLISNQENVHKLHQESEERIRIETQRASQITSFQQELDHERHDVSKLQISARELEENTGYTENAKLLIECEQDIETARTTIAATRARVEQTKDACKKLQMHWETVCKPDICAQWEGMQERVKTTDTSLQASKDASYQLRLDVEAGIQREEQRIVQNGEAKSRVNASKINTLIEKYPKIQDVVSSFQGDETSTYDEQERRALEDIDLALHAITFEAESLHSRRTEAKTLAHQRAEEAAAYIKRKEEKRRRNLERIDAGRRLLENQDGPKQRREKEAPAIGEVCNSRKILSPLDHPSVEVTIQQSRGADFYLPQNEDHYLEPETPAEPKCLLQSFTMILESPEKLSPCTLTQTNDKRVHWDDEHTSTATHKRTAKPKPAAARKVKQYGRLKRCFPAISRQKSCPSTKGLKYRLPPPAVCNSFSNCKKEQLPQLPQKHAQQCSSTSIDLQHCGTNHEGRLSQECPPLSGTQQEGEQQPVDAPLDEPPHKKKSPARQKSQVDNANMHASRASTPHSCDSKWENDKYRESAGKASITGKNLTTDVVAVEAPDFLAPTSRQKGRYSSKHHESKGGGNAVAKSQSKNGTSLPRIATTGRTGASRQARGHEAKATKHSPVTHSHDKFHRSELPEVKLTPKFLSKRPNNESVSPDHSRNPGAEKLFLGAAKKSEELPTSSALCQKSARVTSRSDPLLASRHRSSTSGLWRPNRTAVKNVRQLKARLTNEEKSRKRSVAQSSGITSQERHVKSRRRKKKENSDTQLSVETLVVDDAYSFAF